jgi:hypothetical protein
LLVLDLPANPATLIPTASDLGNYIVDNGLLNLGIKESDLNQIISSLAELKKEFPKLKNIQLTGNAGIHGQMAFQFFVDGQEEPIQTEAMFLSEFKEKGLLNFWKESINEFKKLSENKN